jgi:CPA1 family monovalent cation:H+ antiporter
MSWASTRSVIGLVIALSIPPNPPKRHPFPERDLILIIGAFLVIGSVVVQGLTLRTAVIKADLCEAGEEDRELDLARTAIAGASGDASGENSDSHDAARQALIALRNEKSHWRRGFGANAAGNRPARPRL